jgi:dGTPase
MITRIDLEERERKTLKPYACFSEDAIRLVPGDIKIHPHPIRTNFQRDRDRIIHSKSFRRLEYKTQVYLTENGDHLRTRLTHSLEVSQIARTIALQLGLNVDLVEAIALGHDVGHTPFGHAAEKRLNELLQEDSQSGFKHNVQSVSIFYNLERKYEYSGLALTVPVLEGILKHTKFKIDLPNYFNNLYINKDFSVTLEGQVVAIADEIAQITHDLDDYLRFHILSVKDFLKQSIFDKIREFSLVNYKKSFDEIINIDEELRKEVIVRCLVDYLVTSLINETSNKLNDYLRAYEIDSVYIDYIDIKNEVESFHKYIIDKCLNEYRVREMDKRGKEIITTLYNYYKEFPKKLPESTREKYYKDGIVVIANYISGMTDRYAIQEYNNIIKL